MLIADKWQDYELLDTSDGERLERWGKYILIRPDPQVIWSGLRRHPGWNAADAVYNRSKSGGGSWNISKLPEEWEIGYESLGLRFLIRPTGFKHTGLFPEQAANWERFVPLIRERINENDAAGIAGKPKVLNLFAYTGGATVSAAAAGAEVTHVDAAKGMVAQARTNARLSGLGEAPIRYIVDDCGKFVEREIRRGVRYEGVIMDPPSYGRGPGGELWKLEESLFAFVRRAVQVLSDKPLFFLINSYTTGLSPAATAYVLREALKGHQNPRVRKAAVTSDEVGLPVTASGGVLPCGSAAFGIW